MAYLYRHIRLDKNEVFYIGIGSDSTGHYYRAFSKCKKTRNIHWHNTIKKTSYEVEIVLDDISWEEACIKEREFIALYGRKDLNLGTLVNKADGGEGAHNISDSTKLLISNRTKEALSDPLVREKISKAGIGRTVSKETRDKISKGNKGTVRPDLIEYNKKRSKENHPYYGKSSARKGVKDENAKHRALKTVICPHCFKQVQKIVSNRWHFNNCKKLKNKD